LRQHPHTWKGLRSLKIPLLQRRAVVGVLLALLLLLQGTESVLAGTTGSIAGIVIDSASHKPIPGAQVTAASPSQNATTTTDASGHYAFLSLAPDTYTISVAAGETYDASSVSGVTIQSDQALNQTLSQPAKLRTIGKVTSRAASSLIKPGTTADTYSINATTQDKASQVGGGGTLNSAWSALSTVPGVFVAPGLNGYIGAGASLSIRGGDYDQIGYEFDGIPINRSFDNYPSNSLPSLGQQELQVYTGGAPANAEAQGISGYINQVIKTGSSPGFDQIAGAVGGPAYYHKFTIETGGANTSHTFSYYVGLGGYNQDARYGDQFNGADVSKLWGFPIGSCSATVTFQQAPSCFTANGTRYNATTPSWILGSTLGLDEQASTSQRDSIVNFHFGIPYKNGNKDDIQLLLDINHLGNSGYTSANDLGGDAFLNAVGIGAPTYLDTYQVQVPYGTVFPVGYQGGPGVVAPYLFPSTPTGRAGGLGGTLIDPNYRDSSVNNQNIFKVQYQHNFGSNAYLRLYGYTYYSDWLQNGPNSTDSCCLGYQSADYELNSHTRGLSLSFADQINSKNLLSLVGSYTTANVTRYNNSFTGIGTDTAAGYLVDGNDPYNGVAYNLAGGAVPGAQYNAAGLPFAKLTVGQILAGTGAVPAAGVTCGGGPCQYMVVGGGPSATYNQVKPKFTAFSITDDFRPTSKLDINAGLRYDLFQFVGANTFNSGARSFFYNAYNSQAAANGVTPLAFDPSGTGNSNSYPVFQPRLGLTYTLNPATVVRASYGRYAQAPNTAFEQYNYLQPNDLGKLIGFGENGLPTTPGHSIVPPVSNNFDFSVERQFGSDFALKATPFLRKTQNQIQQFYLDQKTNFVSGLNVGNQTSEGFEFEADKGDFARNGFAARLSFTYTNSYIRYNRTPSGTSVVDPINAAISQFNGYTKAGGGLPYYSLANATTGAAGVGSTTGGAGYIANPYYNAPLQGLLDPNGNFPTFDLFPGGITSTASTYGAPYFATLLVQYKHGPVTVTPSLQFNAGQRYGIPENTPGVQPDQIVAALPGTAAGDPRYIYGSPGAAGAPYSAVGNLNTIAVPDIYTGRFDGLGAFVQPSFLQLNTQFAFDLSKRVTLVATLSNLYTNYFGGSHEAWTVKGGQAYGNQCLGCGSAQPTGNVYDPGAPLQPFTAATYIPQYYGLPFGVYVEARVKI
jgi:hypothetical protein